MFSLSMTILSCQKEKKNENGDKQVRIDTTLENSVWVNAKYLETIEKTKSPLQASAFADTAIISFNAKADTASVTWNFHEGSQYRIVRGKTVQFFNTYEVKNVPEMEGIFENIKLKVGNSYFTKVDTISFFEKKYWYGKHKYKNVNLAFLPNGSITGIDSLSSYYIWADYVTTQTDIDLIDLKTKNNKSKTYGYKVKENKITFFDFIWEESDIIGKKGKELFTITRN
jgi:hypothetical protein